MKQRIVLLVAVAALVIVILGAVAWSNFSGTQTPPASQATARPRVTRTAGPAGQGTAEPTQDVLDDSSAEVTVAPGDGPAPTQDPLDDSSGNVTRTPKPAKTQASRPPTITLALAPLMPSAVDSMVWTGNATAAQIQKVKQYFSGRQVLFSWRDGDTGATSTALKQIVEHCAGRYTLMGSSDAQKAPEAGQQATWRDQGSWDVIPSGNQILLTYRSITEQTQTVPVGIQTGGDVVVLNTNLVAMRQGPAVCE